jgi:hypothetical protein
MHSEQSDDREIGLFELWMGMTPEEWESLAPADDAVDRDTDEV